MLRKTVKNTLSYKLYNITILIFNIIQVENFRAKFGFSLFQ